MHPHSEFLALPFLHRCIRLEVIGVFEVEPLVLAVELDGSFFATGDDRVDVLVDDQATLGQKGLAPRKPEQEATKKLLV